ncbi:uroporphyrinogen decarboxylase [Niabella insulamsoli]|uniref:uroporphyrinogen decarboxylase n=1 Tax=Niabella insulamsoli TaxID=3144874 RepID=UPI0031FBB45C
MLEIVDIVGYSATLLLVVSFLPRQMTKVRILNFFACIIFIIYGVMLGLKWPIIISNAVIAVIQLYHLFIKEKR